MSDCIVGLDIGTSKIVTIIGEVNDNGNIEIIGVGKSKSQGMSRGIVVDIQNMTQSIDLSIKDAELMAEYKIEDVFAGISGNHISCMNSMGKFNIKDQTVTQADINSALEIARSYQLPENNRFLHCIPQEFSIDGQGGIRNPIGMAGLLLTVNAHLVSASSAACQNIENCITRCNLQCNSLILEQLASSNAVLTEDERNLGACIIDIGAGTSDIAIFSEGSIQYTSVIPFAGNMITSEIARSLRTPMVQAEKIKITSGCAYQPLVDLEAMVEVLSIGKREPQQASKQIISQIVQERYQEIFTKAKEILDNNQYLELATAGIVLTGGGSKIEGISELAEEFFGIPVRVGVPDTKIVSGMSDIASNPVYATAIGLLLTGLDMEMDKNSNQLLNKNRKKQQSRSSFFKWIAKQF